jgi:phosphate transport system substrate-binding protein
MRTGRTQTAGVLAALIFLAATGAIAAERVTIGTGTTAAGNIFFRILEPLEKASNLKLAIITGGPVQGLKDLDIGMVEAAVGGLTFDDWMTLMEREGAAVKNKQAYNSEVIGADTIQVITHKEVNISSLNKEQLANIFEGKAKNWATLGGPNLPIVVFANLKSPGTIFVFQKEILEGKPYSPETVQLATESELKPSIRRTPGSIALATQSQVDDTVAVPAIPKVDRPITLITKGKPSAGVAKMIEFIRGPGQQFIVK